MDKQQTSAEATQARSEIQAFTTNRRQDEVVVRANFADELGCRWDDPDLDIPWPCTEPLISQRDRELGSLSDLRDVWRGVPAPA